MPKIFVLDTSVLLFDHNAVTSFQENDIVIPITVLEELDQFKIGNDTKNFEAREVIRYLDKLSEHKNLDQWISRGDELGKLKIYNVNGYTLETDAEAIYGEGKNDHKILNVALALAKEYKRTKIVLVTKDINLRIKAKALHIEAEDYLTGRVENLDQVSEGTIQLSNLNAKIIQDIYAKERIQENNLLNGYKVANGYYVLNNCSQSALVRYDENTDSIIKVEKQYVYGIKPKNAEQTFAIDALLNEEIKLVALQGVAGTGKTILALAAALEQMNKYEQILLTRPIVPLSNKEIGFLPGDAEDKISPYMLPLWDNLKFIKSQHKDNSKKSQVVDQLKDSGKLEVTALTFIRGRSLTNTFFIVDEAQNLTPHEIKTVITRAGEGTKIIFTGDIHQIDTPYMDERSNGLSYIIDKLKGQKLFAHVKLEKGERSELADIANKYL
jgi:PhoH-like ATPase